jgi:protein gp37
MAVRLSAMARAKLNQGDIRQLDNPYMEVVSIGKRWVGKATLVESALDKPLHWHKPRKIFVCSMGDLFHESVDWSWVDQVMCRIAQCPQHVFQVLTKRPERMREYFNQPDLWTYHIPVGFHNGPLLNLWLGVTCENQQRADERIPYLLRIPAAVRFVSLEPLLGPIDFRRVPGLNKCGSLGQELLRNFWVIVGCETGPRARPCENRWIDDIVAQCRRAGVPVFVKKVMDEDTLGLSRGWAVDNTDLERWPREMPEVKQ